MTGKILIDYLPENSDTDIFITVKCKESDYHEIGIAIECLRSGIIPLMNKTLHDITDFRIRNAEGKNDH